eukprot:4801436-Amphidinium_carterae.1
MCVNMPSCFRNEYAQDGVLALEMNLVRPQTRFPYLFAVVVSSQLFHRPCWCGVVFLGIATSWRLTALVERFEISKRAVHLKPRYRVAIARSGKASHNGRKCHPTYQS